MNKGHKWVALIAWAAFSLIDLFIEARRRFILPNLVVSLLFYKSPDMDLANGLKHRHWSTHSCVISILLLVFFPEAYFLAIIAGVHLLADIYQDPSKKPVGSYLIHFRGSRLSSRQTKAFLFINGVICICGSIIAMIPL